MRTQQRSSRICSRASCNSPAIKTLTYIYAESTAVLGPLALYAEPHSYDLCLVHSEKLTLPNGWSVTKLEPSAEQAAAWATYAEDETAFVVGRVLAIEEAWRAAHEGRQ